MTKSKRKLTYQMVVKEVRHLDPKLEKNGPREFKCACMMLSALSVGANLARIARFMGTPITQEMRDWAWFLRRSKVWVGDKTACAWFGKDGGIAFWIDVAVAMGWIKRSDAA